jgi:hypothetical protein
MPARLEQSLRHRPALLYRREMRRKDAVDILRPDPERLVAALEQPIARREASDDDDVRMNLGRNGGGHFREDLLGGNLLERHVVAGRFFSSAFRNCEAWALSPAS